MTMPDRDWVSEADKERDTMRMAESRQRSVMMSFRVTPAERDAIEAKARERGKSVGQFVREAALPPGLSLYAGPGDDAPTFVTVTGGPYQNRFVDGVLYATMSRRERRRLRKRRAEGT